MNKELELGVKKFIVLFIYQGWFG